MYYFWFVEDIVQFKQQYSRSAFSLMYLRTRWPFQRIISCILKHENGDWLNKYGVYNQEGYYICNMSFLSKANAFSW